MFYYKLRLRIIVIYLTLLINSCCNAPKQNNNLKAYEGFWYSEIKNENDEQKFIFHFKNDDNFLTGEAHSYWNNVKLEPVVLGEILIDQSSIRVEANPEAGVIFKGNLNNDKTQIIGHLYYPGGDSAVFNLTKLTYSELQKNFPGLLTLDNNANLAGEKPKNLNDGIKISTCKDEKINTDQLKEMVVQVNNGEFGKVESILILRNNKLIFEQYFNGFGQNDLHVLQSTTKSIAALLIQIAIDKNFIKSVDEKVIDFFPEYSHLVTKGWAKIKIKHILSMSAGLDWGNGTDEIVQRTSNNIINDVLSRKAKYEPGTKMEYRSPNVNLIAGIINNSTGMQADKFAEQNLLIPLGIKTFSWRYDWNNSYPRLDGSLALRPRDMAKIGLMILNNGKFNEKQILSKEKVKELTSKQINVDELFNYGYLWWISESQSNPGTKLIFSNGHGGQHIIIVPKFNLVVVTTGGNFNNGRSLDLLKMTDKYIINSLK